jgi:hypothetical protein
MDGSPEDQDRDEAKPPILHEAKYSFLQSGSTGI